MIRQTIYIDKLGWLVYAYFYKTKYDVDEIMEKLFDLGCDSKTAWEAYENLSSDSLNTGLCYSNYKGKQSVMVVGKTSCAAELFNSFHHELKHLESHISKVFQFDPLGEDAAYLSGELAMIMFPKIKHLLCDCCRKKEDGYEKA